MDKSNFINEIKKIAADKTAGGDGSKKGPDRTPLDEPSAIQTAMDELMSIGAEGVEVYNGALGCDELFIYETPSEVLSTFLNFSSNRLGFCLIGMGAYVIFVDDTQEEILVLGRKKGGGQGGNLPKTNTIQLIKITVGYASGVLSMKDNTGAPLNPLEVMALVIKWVTSA